MLAFHPLLPIKFYLVIPVRVNSIENNVTFYNLTFIQVFMYTFVFFFFKTRVWHQWGDGIREAEFVGAFAAFHLVNDLSPLHLSIEAAAG